MKKKLLFVFALILSFQAILQAQTKDSIFYQSEQLPIFPGGEEALRLYIAENVEYPIKAMESEIQGTVYLRFVVNKTGQVENPFVLRSVHPLLDTAAVKIVLSLPNFTPGYQKGKPVAVWYTVPITFRAPRTISSSSSSYTESKPDIIADFSHIYYDAEWYITDESVAKYYRTGKWNCTRTQFEGKITDYFMNGDIISECGYTSSIKNGYTGSVKNGSFKSYYESGEKKIVGKYAKNRPVGIWNFYYENGQLMQKVEYKVNKSFIVKKSFTSNGVPIVENGNGSWSYSKINTKGNKITITGNFTNKKRDGKWDVIKEQDTIVTELYENGKFIKGILYTQDSIFEKKYTLIADRILQPSHIHFTEELYYRNFIRYIDYQFLSFLPYPNANETYKPIMAQAVGLDDENNIIVLEKQPTYPFGQEGINKLLKENIKYPKQAIENNISGKIYVQFIINESGIPVNITVVRGIGYDCDQESSRVLNLMTRWQPGYVNGKPIKSKFTYLVEFKL